MESKLWLSMVYDAAQKFTKLPDGSFDFSAPDGQFHILNGAGGHENKKFKEEWTDNHNVLYANHEE